MSDLDAEQVIKLHNRTLTRAEYTAILSNARRKLRERKPGKRAALSVIESFVWAAALVAKVPPVYKWGTYERELRFLIGVLKSKKRALAKLDAAARERSRSLVY